MTTYQADAAVGHGSAAINYSTFSHHVTTVYPKWTCVPKLLFTLLGQQRIAHI